MDIDAVIIWGHKLHTHTHSYIHNAFYKAFQFLGYKCYWVDDTTSERQFPEKSLYITEGAVCDTIILNSNSYYILHNCDLKKFIDAKIPSTHILVLQVFTLPCITRCPPLNNNKFIRFDGKTLYMPWATDLIPEEIDINIDRLDEISKCKPICHFIGFYLNDPWKFCKDICDKNDIAFSACGGFFTEKVSITENMRRVQESLIAPSFQQPWQVENGYIPCRIFKNISYGKMGITNSETVNELFGGRLIFDKDVHVATQRAIDYVVNGENLQLLKDLMIEVRDKHTYLHRITDIFEAFSKIKSEV
jgi:hypothetical protein